ncbi:hypothetical protein TNCV_3587391 [Trichonephila clavipes]|nr:hypothetical protein TNCV_3587391 [Trichonephila clavipes]
MMNNTAPVPMSSEMRNIMKIPNDDFISRVFIEFSSLEQVITIYPSMATEWAGLVSSRAKPVEAYSQKVMSGG